MSDADKNEPQLTSVDSSKSSDSTQDNPYSHLYIYVYTFVSLFVALYTVRHAIIVDAEYHSYSRNIGIACANRQAFSLMGVVFLMCFLFPFIIALSLGICRKRWSIGSLLFSLSPFVLFLAMFLASPGPSSLLSNELNASLIMTTRNEAVLMQFQVLEFQPRISLLYTQPEMAENINLDGLHTNTTYRNLYCDSKEASYLCPASNWISKRPTSQVLRCELNTEMIFEFLPVLLNIFSMGAVFCMLTVFLFVPLYLMSFCCL